MNTTTWKNRVLSVVLTVIMVFSMLPLSVFAAETAVAEVTVNGKTAPYTDIDAAFAAAQEADSATVKLLADVTISHADNSGIALEKGNITLDLNGKTLSKSTRDDNGFYSKNAVFWLSPPGATTKDDFLAALQMPVRLTVQDSSADGNGKIVQPNGGPAIIATFNTTLTVNAGTIENKSSVDHDNQFHMAPNCAVLLSGGGKAVINGGTLRGMRGVAVTGYITKEEEDLYKEYLGIDGYNNDTYGNELTVTGGEISGTDGEALVVYEKAKKIELSGGTFTTQSNDYSIWVDDTEDGEETLQGDAASLPASGYRFENNGAECTYSENGNGVVGNATVALRPANEYVYIDKDGKLTTQANCTEITADKTELTAAGWYVVKENVTGYSAFVFGTVNLILCDGAEWNLSGGLLMGDGAVLNIYVQSAGTGKLTATGVGKGPAIGMDTGKSGGTLNIYGGVITAASHIDAPPASGEAGVSENRGAAIGTCGGSSNSNMTVHIYGGTVTAKATYGAAAIGKGQAANGTVNVTIADGMKCVKTDEPTVKAEYTNTDGDSVTITKCNDHQWAYTQSGDTQHTATCTLCNTGGGAENHSYIDWKSNGADTHTGTCVCGAESTENHTLTCSPNIDGLTHSGKCSECGYEVGTENHDFNQTDEYGKKCACGAYLAASYNGQNYTSLADAVEAAKNGGTVKLEMDVQESIIVTDGMNVTVDLNRKTWFTTHDGGNKAALTVDGGRVTVKNGTMQTGGMASACTPVVINGGSLAVGESVTVSGTEWDTNQYCHAIEVNGGELTLSVGTVMYCGMKVSAEGKQLKDYLPQGAAFAVDGSVVNGYVQEKIGKFTLNVVAHTTHTVGENNKCDCGFVCDHTDGNSREAGYFLKAVCAICHNEYGEVVTDNTAPTGSITIKERTWFEGLINKITFGLFFKEDVTATVTAEDDSYKQAGYDKSKHAVKIEYLVSKTVIDKEDLEDRIFFAYTNAIDLTDEQNYVVYARLTDHAGNVTYLSTDGFVIDKTAPSINDFADGQTVKVCGMYYDISIKDANLKTVTLDGVEQSGDTIQLEYQFGEAQIVVATDKAGNQSTVTFIQYLYHDFDSETGVCSNCGAAAAAKVQIGDEEANLYGTFDEAWDSILRVTKPVKLALLADADSTAGYVSLGNFDLTIDLNGYTFGHTGQKFVLEEVNNVGTSKLTVTGAGRFLSSILAGTNGHLTVEADVSYISGIKILFNQYGEEDSPTNWSVALKGGKYGVIDLTYEDNDDNTQTAGTLCDLLAPGYVFTDSTAADSSSAANVEVVPCTNHIWDNGVCSTCKLPCTHNWNGNKCTVCDYVCPHSSVEERDGNTYCTTCKQQMAVKVEKDGSTTYYAARRNPYSDETLWWLFNNALESDSTVTLLADNLYAWAFVSGGKQITLDLNGKTLTETFQGITVGQGSQEDTSTNNKLTVKGTLGASEAAEADSYAFRTRSGGELNLEDFEGGGKIGGIIADGGKVTTGVSNADIKIGTLYIINGDTDISFRAGTFDKISFSGSSGSVKLGDLLAKGYAFQKADGSYVAYDTVISEVNALENVTVVKCDHTKLPESFSGSICPYCNTALAATVTAKSGQISGYTDFGAALDAANAASGCTLTLLADVNSNLAVKANVTIHLSPNGHTVSGNVIVQKNASLTVTGGTFSGKINCVGALNLTGSTLTGDLSVIENVALDSCYVGKAVTVNKGGTLTVTGGSLTGVTVNNGGTLTFQNGNISGTAEAKSGGSVVVSGGHIDTLAGEDNAKLTLSGGNFTKITVSGNNLIDCLANGCAFRDSNGIVDGRTAILFNVEVIEHLTHAYAWNTITHELVCACGNVAEKDTDDPLLYDNGNKLLEDGGSYYGDFIFTVEEKNLDKIVVDSTVVTAENGKYKIIADNKSHVIEASDLAGNTVSIVVNVYKIYNVNASDGIGYTVEAVKTANHGQNYTFTVTVRGGYTATKDFIVTVNGEAVTATLNGNTYTYTVAGSKVTDNLNIEVQGVRDITAPTAEMTIGTNRFKELLSSLTFGLFFKETQTVKVTATDAGSGVAKAEYLLSEKAFDKTADVIGNWTELNLNNGTGRFSIAPNVKASVYVRVTDKAGNFTVINSTGVVVYTDSEASTNSITFTRLSKTDVSITVDFKGNTVKSVFCDGIELNGTSYNVLYPSAGSGSTLGTIVLNNMFLKNLTAGEHPITVEYNPMGETYVDAAGNDAPDFTEVMLTVEKADRTLEFSAPDAEYDGKAYDDLTITDRPDGTMIRYKKQDAADSTYGTAAPKNAGSYTVKITVDADENYNAKTFTKDFTISPKKVTIIGVTAANKTYDGTTAATIVNTGTLSGKCEGDDLTINAGNAEAAFANKNVGSYIVTFDGFKLGGSAKDNYDLIGQPASVTADINRKELTVENLKIKTKQYDGTNKAEIDGTPTLKGVANGDNLSLVNGTPTFTSTAVGEDISVSFTWFYLLGDEVTLKNYTLAQPTGITGNIIAWIADGSEYSVNSNDWINTDFTVTAKSGYLLRTDTTEGDWKNELTASEETSDGKLTFYVKNADTGVISSAVTESYKIDKTAPTGAITFNERTSFQKFLSTITFGLFFKDDVTVRLTGADEASGVKSMEYYKSDKALTLEEVKVVTDWTQSNSFDITAEDMAQFVIYARITDKGGNITYLSSDGAEFDTTAPKIIGVENGKIYYVTQRVFADDVTPASVTLNGVAQDVDSFFELAGDTDAVYTIVATDKAGNVTEYTVTMKPISAITDAVRDITADNVTSADADTINKVTQKILDIAAESDEDVIGAEQWNKLLTAAENCKKLEQRIAEVSVEITRFTDAVNGYDIENVTGTDKSDIERLITDIDALLVTDNLTASENAALEALKETAQSLLDRIADAKSAAEADEITAVKKITKDNVTLDDKDALEKAEKSLEKALNVFDGNYTDDEHKALDTALDTVKEALSAIDNAEKAAEEIEKLPSADEVKLTDKDEIERISKIIDALTENEKAMLGENSIDKLKALNDKLTELVADKPTSPGTGDTNNLALWIALLFISGGVITGVTFAGKKKKQQD